MKALSGAPVRGFAPAVDWITLSCIAGCYAAWGFAIFWLAADYPLAAWALEDLVEVGRGEVRLKKQTRHERTLTLLWLGARC